MQYALLAYAPPEDTDRAARPIPGTLAALLDRPAGRHRLGTAPR
jgi:hypothetical protein